MRARWVLCPDCRGIEKFDVREGQVVPGCRTCDGMGRVRIGERRGIDGITVLGLVILAFLVGLVFGSRDVAASSGATLASVPLLPGASFGIPDAPPPAATAGAPAVAVAPSSTSTAGIASWYDDGPGLYAAVPSYRFGGPRYALRVTSGDRSVVVQVRDFCGCPNRLIDLSRDAFAELAPLSKGLIRVSIAPVGLTTPPPTDLEEGS